MLTYVLGLFTFTIPYMGYKIYKYINKPHEFVMVRNNILYDSKKLQFLFHYEGYSYYYTKLDHIVCYGRPGVEYDYKFNVYNDKSELSKQLIYIYTHTKNEVIRQQIKELIPKEFAALKEA